MLVLNAKDGASPKYYTYNARFEHIGGSLLFTLLSRIPDSLKYFDLYKITSHMGTDPVLTAPAFHRCGKVDLNKTAVREGLVSYDILTSEIYGLNEKAVQAKKRLRGVDGVSATVTLAVVLVTLRADVLRGDLVSIRHVGSTGVR